jgi:hypothetical protein
MRTLVLLLGVLAVMGLALPAMADTTPVNGYLHEVNGQRVLHVWGTHYEMGYAHGVLLGKEIVQSMNEYVLNLLPPAIYSAAHIIAPLLFQLPDEYREEVRGMIDGVFASGANAFITPLNRYLDADDLIFCNAVGDIGAMACSSQIVWDSATKDDPQLHGETALVRNLDWALAGPNRFLLPESTIVVPRLLRLPVLHERGRRGRGGEHRAQRHSAVGHQLHAALLPHRRDAAAGAARARSQRRRRVRSARRARPHRGPAVQRRDCDQHRRAARSRARRAGSRRRDRRRRLRRAHAGR